MRFVPHLLTVLMLLVALSRLPEIWQPERDLGVLSEQNIEKDKGASLGVLPVAERDRLIRREMDVLRSRPLDEAAHRNLALLSLVPPMSPSARQLILNLARHSMRNPAIQMAAMGVLIESGNLTETAYRIDAVLRSNPDLQEQIFPILVQNFSGKEGVKALVDTLAQDPDWRLAFLGYLANQPNTEKLCIEVLRGLKSTKLPPKILELRYIFGYWIKATGNYERSYFVWLDQLTDGDLRFVKGVYDGEFSSEPKGLYFDWNISNSRNGRASLKLKPGSGVDRSLLVDFLANKEPFSQVNQYLKLSAGSYKLSYDAMSKNIEAEAGLVWRVACLDKPLQVAESPALKSPMPWIRQGVEFNIPAENCSTQLLSLETKARQGLDTAINGQVHYDSIAIDRVPNGSAP